MELTAELAGAPVLEPRAIRRMLDSDDPAPAIFGVLATEASGISMDPAALASAVGLSGAARGVALAAIARMTDRDAAASRDDLPSAATCDRMLRSALAAGNASGFHALASRAARVDPGRAASVAIGLVRLGLAELAPALGRRHPGLATLPRRERELCEAIRQVALGTLSGEAAPAADTADARLWRAVGGDPGADSEGLAVASLAVPLPLTQKSGHRDRRPTLDELDRLMTHFLERSTRRPSSVPMHRVMALAIFSSRRQEEITRIMWADLDPEGKRVLVRDMKNPGEKIGNNVWCDLLDPALAIIEAMPKHSDRIFPYSTDAIGASFTRARPGARDAGRR